MFNLKKIVAVLCLLTKELGVLDKGKICKLLFYIDKIHLIEYGRIVTGDRYYKLPNGPIPTRVLDILNDHKNVLFPEELQYFEKHLDVATDKNRSTKCIKHPDYDELSKSEKSIINRVIKDYGSYNFIKLVDITHEDNSFKMTNKQEEITIQKMIIDLPVDRQKELVSFLKNQKETEAVLSLL